MSADRDALIARYRDGYRAVVDALKDADLDAPGGDGGWTPRQIVHHLADSETTSALRLRRLLVEDEPEIQGYDEAAFARKLRYDVRPIEASLSAFQAARETSSQLLDLLTEDEWRRKGTHSESGTYGVQQWLEIYAAHAHDHAEQIVRCKR
jgi:hypothetical protein